MVLIPGTEDIEFKPKFIERYSKLTNWAAFREYSLTFLRKSIRVNTLKISVEDLKKRLNPVWQLDPVPWCKEAFFIEHRGINEAKRRDVGNLPEHILGYIYVQEAASMIPPIVLNPKPKEVVLDMCAAPGSKTTQIANRMNNKGTLIANDADGSRLAALGINLQRCGVQNCILTNMQGRFFKRVNIEFDRILVDAPCSGIGTIRKSLKTIKMWNPNMVRRLAGTQRQLIQTAFDKLKKGGNLVYSTCTTEPEEDEGVISWLLDSNSDAKTEKINLNINAAEPITEFEKKQYNEGVKNTLRLWPQDNNTEGFFVAKIKKY